MILYDLVRYLVTENDRFLARFNSLCRSFSVDVPLLLSKFSTARNARLIARALNCKTCTDEEIDLRLPDDALRELLRLKLRRITRTARRSARLTPAMRGAACVTGTTVFRACANRALIDFLEAEYNCSVYTHVDVDRLVMKPRSKVYFCGVDPVPFFPCISASVVSNIRARVELTDACVDALLSEQHAALLQQVFMNGADTALNVAMRQIFYFLRGGQTPNGAPSIDLVSCS
uniref:Late transcription elongation factor OPG087 n=1 Tax=Rousettus bat poxvirus TaxID=3141933 RepID=A0AAU7E282_9POXV